MPKITPRNHKLNEHDFLKLSKAESKPRARVKLLILHQLSQNKSLEDIGKDFGYHPQSIGIIRKNYWLFGLKSIYDKPGRGRKSRLAEKDIEAFKQAIVEAGQQRGGGRLTATDIARIAKEDFNATYTPKGIYGLLHRIGMSWVSARSQHPKADPEVMETFKKTL